MCLSSTTVLYPHFFPGETDDPVELMGGQAVVAHMTHMGYALADTPSKWRAAHPPPSSPRLRGTSQSTHTVFKRCIVSLQGL